MINGVEIFQPCKDFSFYVSPEDLQIALCSKWRYEPKVGVTKNSGATYRKLSREILRLHKDDKRYVDFIDGNNKNNTRENLRICIKGFKFH